MNRLQALGIWLLFFASVSAQTSALSEMRKLMEGRVRFTERNSIVFFASGKEKFDDLFKAVREAKESIHMEYFNFRDDSIANSLFDLLAEKVKQGVEVRLIYDDFGNTSNNQPIRRRRYKEIQATGVQLYVFDPIRFPWVNHIIPRDHRKIVVIDGKTAYSGGMNVADYYIKGKPEIGEWHDIHYRIEGDAVIDYQRIFFHMWKRVTGEELSGAKYYPGESYESDALKGLVMDSTSTARKKTIAVVNREPHTSPRIVRQTFLNAIQTARKHIQIINPYFTLNHPLRKALKNALKRGVRLEIMVSETSDIPITPRVVEYQVRKLQKQGAEVYFYQGGFHHSKIMMIDDEFCYAGSANLDSRSLRCDYECNALILDAEATKQLSQIFEKDKKNRCIPLTDEYWKKRSAWKNFNSWACNLLNPFI